MNAGAGTRSRWKSIVAWMLVSAAIALVLPATYVELSQRDPAPVTLPAYQLTAVPRVYVIDWGYHTAIVVPQPVGWRLGPPNEEAAPYVEYAWGDLKFYMESNYWPHSVFATLFLPTSAVTYVDGHWTAPDHAAGARAVYARDVTPAQLTALLGELERWIARDSLGGRSLAFAPVQGYDGRFYRGFGAYIWSANCNRWTADRLAAAGLARDGRGVLFSGQVERTLYGFSKVSSASTRE